MQGFLFVCLFQDGSIGTKIAAVARLEPLNAKPHAITRLNGGV